MQPNVAEFEKSYGIPQEILQEKKDLMNEVGQMMFNVFSHYIFDSKTTMYEDLAYDKKYYPALDLMVRLMMPHKSYLQNFEEIGDPVKFEGSGNELCILGSIHHLLKWCVENNIPIDSLKLNTAQTFVNFQAQLEGQLRDRGFL
jgi:hypothetical protein